MITNITNAKDLSLDESLTQLPNMRDAILEWLRPITFSLVTKSITNFKVTETVTTINTQGVRQPMSPQQLELKPEGQRAWKWQTLHCLPNIQLLVDDIVVFDGIKYRVMQKLDWKEYGYLEYHICEAFQ